MSIAALHGFFRSSASYRVRIALELKGIPYSKVEWPLREGLHRSADYAQINPQRLVPALVPGEGGAALTQSLAIIEYLEETHPEPALLPATPRERAHVRSLALLIAADMHPLNNLRVLRFLEQKWAVETAQVNEWYRHWVVEGFDAFEAELARSPSTGRFCFGDTPTLADIFLVPQIYNARRFDVDLAPYSRILSMESACGQLSAFEAARPEQQGAGARS
jgi:maleylacetoacetate isomerase